MLFGKKHRLAYLASVTSLITVANLVLGPLFFSFESDVIPKANAASVTWVGGSTGTWETGTNWSSGVVPTVSDDVTISSTTGNIVVTLSSGQTANFASLTIGGDATYYATTTFVGNIGTAVSTTVANFGVFVQQNTVTQTLTGNLTIKSGGILTHTGNSSSQTSEVDMSVANLNVQSGGSINIDGKGYTGTNGATNAAGGGNDCAGGGGAHGGSGGSSQTWAGCTSSGGLGYGNISNPLTIGSGGGGRNGSIAGSGSQGGGFAKLNVTGTFTINGTITANGTAGNGTNGGYGDGGGAGGAINITAGTIAGTPQSITATGGAGKNDSADGGGGGGGLVYISYTTDAASSGILDASSISVNGGSGSSGQTGGAGLVLVKTGSTDGTLFVKNAGVTGTSTLQVPTSLTVDALTITANAIYAVRTGKTLVLDTATALTSGDDTGLLIVDVGATLTPPVSFTLDDTTVEFHQGATWTNLAATTLTLGTQGILRLSEFTTATAYGLSNLTIQNTGIITHASNTTAQTHVINISAANLSIDAGGAINVDGKGYTASNGTGPGGGNDCAGGGGAHGGNGGSSQTWFSCTSSGGTAYGSITSPTTIGSGGGGRNGTIAGSGSQGGGLIKLTVTSTLTINGTITADGLAGSGANGGYGDGGGAGGAMNITAGIIAGTPQSITATGGAGMNDTADGGGGGGGLVYFDYTTSTSISSGDISVAGGTSAGGTAGSVGLIQLNSQPSGPSNLFSNATTAATTSTNPTNLTTTTPFFSGIFNDADSGDTTALAHIQVSTSSDFSLITHWDSGASGTSITSCSKNSRCQDIKYGNLGTTPSTTLSLGDDTDENSQTVYYWRMRYFDAAGVAGAFSTTTAYFTLLDKPNAPSGISAGSITVSGATLSWTDGSNIETGFKLEASLDGGASFSPATTTAASATSLATSSLSVDTRYVYRVAGTNNVGTSSYSTSSAFYTLANSAGTPSVAAASATSLTVTIDVNSNPTSTRYSLYNSTSGNYLAADGSSTASPVYQTTSTWGSSFVATGLTPNTAYQFVAISRNGDNTNTATSSASTAVYSLANVPSSMVVQTTATTGQLLVSWNANNNAAGTSFYVEETSNSSINSGYITGTSHTFSGLTSGQTYTFHVKARNGNAVETAYSSSVSGNVPSTGGSAAPATPAPAPPAPPLPFGNIPEDVPIEDFAPTGLIKVISAKAGEIDVLQQAGLSSPYQITKSSSVVAVESIDSSLDLTSPFTLDFSFLLDKHPLDGSVNPERKLFAKPGAYFMGYSGSGKSLGMCFTLANGTKVCDRAIERPPHLIATKKQYDYHISWTGSVMDFYDGNEKVDTASVGSIPTSINPLAVGGVRKEYAPGKFTSVFYPATMYVLKIKSEPLLIYTNTPSVKLKIDSGYAPEFALKESDGEPSNDFAGSSFQPVASELNWTLQGKDGKKCVNARFNSLQKKYKYDTFTCVILDTTKPSADFSFDSGLINLEGVVLASPRIFGVSDAGAAVTLTLTLQKAVSTTVSIAPKIPFPTSGVLQLAGENKTTVVNLKANKDGTWVYTLGSSFVPGLYTASVTSKDLAGNVSLPVAKELVLKSQAVEPKPPEPEIPKVPEEPIETPPTEPVKPLPEKPKSPKPLIAPIGKPLNPNEAGLGKSSDSTSNGATLANNGGTNSDLATPQSQSTISEQFISTLATAVDGVGNLAGSIREFLNNPTIQKVNTRIAVPLFATAGLLNTAVGFQLPQLFNLLRYLFGQPTMLWRRRKQKSWGVVYNSFTKLPVDLATVRLIDEATGHVTSSQVTDFHGRYFMSVDQGHYRLEIIKPGFVGFSEHLKEKDEDTRYVNLYHGEAFYPPRDQFEINYNIPLDPVVEQKPTTRILRDHAVAKIQFALSMTGMAASIMSFVVTPTLLTGGFILLHVGLFMLFYKLAHHKLPSSWGTIRSLADKSPVGRVVVRVFDSAYNKLVNTAVSDSKGRYAVLVGPSVYFVTYEKTGFASKQSPVLDYSGDKTGGIGGLINRDEILESGVDE